MDSINTILSGIDDIPVREALNSLEQEIANVVSVPTPSLEDSPESPIEETGSIRETIEIPEESVHKSIRPNSATLLVEETTSRFSGAIWAEKIKEQVIILAGLGGIGSYVGYLLSRIRPARIVIYDPDIVEGANMSGQMYSTRNIGNFKTNALADIMMSYSRYHSIYSNNRRYSFGELTSDIMICGFDNMGARKSFYESWKDRAIRYSGEDKDKLLFIDGRLAAEEFQVFCIKGTDEYHMKQYEENWLFSDEEAEETICSYKQTSHCANMIASIMVNLLVNFIANQCEPLIERDVPFLTSYDASTMYFKTVS